MKRTGERALNELFIDTRLLFRTSFLRRRRTETERRVCVQAHRI